MEGYKESQYNLYYKFNDNVRCIYNSLSGGSITIDNEKIFNNLVKIIKKSNEFSDNNKLKQIAIKNNFIINKKINERDIIRINTRRISFDTTNLDLKISITENCNFNCDYCFVANTSIYENMNLKTINSIVNFVKRSKKHMKNLLITWFGGEPTLQWDKIRYLSKKFISVCNNNKLNYYSIIITNGYLMTIEKIHELSELGIYGVQFTLDGPPNIHNNRRCLKNGNPTFNKILENIKNVPNNISTTVRINFGKENIKEILKVLNFLEEIKGKIEIAFKPIIGVGEYSGIYNNDTNNYYNKKFKESDKCKWRDLNIEALKRGFNVVHIIPPIKVEPCDFRKFNTWNIDPRGNLYKCPLQIGSDNKYIVGKLEEDGQIKIINMPLYLEALSYDPFEYKDCENCKFLPICGHKCGLYIDGISKNKGICPFPNLFNQMIEIQYYKKKLEERNKNGNN